MVNQQKHKQFYCDEIVLFVEDNQTKIVTNNEAYTINNHDEIITQNHVVKLSIVEQWNRRINYDEPRAPVAQMNNDWNDDENKKNEQNL